jgi:ATP-binding protein involved in chromosome partitioning
MSLNKHNVSARKSIENSKLIMKLEKDILKALETITIAGEGKNMVESGAIANVVTGDEVVVDLVLHTPAMHIKKRAEDDIKENTQIVSPDAKIKSTVK